MASTVEPSAVFSVENQTHPARHDINGQMEGVLPSFLSGLSGWQVIVTILLILVTYDQCMLLTLLQLATAF